MFSDIFKYLIQSRKISVYQVSKDTGISESLMSQWKSGRQLPKYDNLNILADYFNVSGDYLLGRTENPNIDNKAIKIVRPEEKKETDIPKRILPFYRTAASAGAGSYLFDDTPVEYINVPKTDTTSAADYILEVRGDSMEPKFYDGDCVLIQQAERIYEGQIGIFILNGESYIKKMGKGELISLNSAYSPIRLHEYDDIRCAGRVLDRIVLE